MAGLPREVLVAQAAELLARAEAQDAPLRAPMLAELHAMHDALTAACKAKRGAKPKELGQLTAMLTGRRVKPLNQLNGSGTGAGP